MSRTSWPWSIVERSFRDLIRERSEAERGNTVTPSSGLSSLFCQPRALLINARRAQQSLYTIKGGVKGVRGREKKDGSTGKVGKGEAECITVEKNGVHLTTSFLRPCVPVFRLLRPFQVSSSSTGLIRNLLFLLRALFLPFYSLCAPQTLFVIPLLPRLFSFSCSLSRSLFPLYRSTASFFF